MLILRVVSLPCMKWFLLSHGSKHFLTYFLNIANGVINDKNMTKTEVAVRMFKYQQKLTIH